MFESKMIKIESIFESERQSKQRCKIAEDIVSCEGTGTIFLRKMKHSPLPANQFQYEFKEICPIVHF